MYGKTIFRLIAILIINSFLLLDVARAGVGEITAAKNTDTLAAPVQVNDQVLVDSFQTFYAKNSSEQKVKTGLPVNKIAGSGNPEFQSIFKQALNSLLFFVKLIPAYVNSVIAPIRNALHGNYSTLKSIIIPALLSSGIIVLNSKLGIAGDGGMFESVGWVLQFVREHWIIILKEVGVILMAVGATILLVQGFRNLLMKYLVKRETQLKKTEQELLEQESSLVAEISRLGVRNYEEGEEAVSADGRRGYVSGGIIWGPDGWGEPMGNLGPVDFNASERYYKEKELEFVRNRVIKTREQLKKIKKELEKLQVDRNSSMPKTKLGSFMMPLLLTPVLIALSSNLGWAGDGTDILGNSLGLMERILPYIGFAPVIFILAFGLTIMILPKIPIIRIILFSFEKFGSEYEKDEYKKKLVGLLQRDNNDNKIRYLMRVLKNEKRSKSLRRLTAQVLIEVNGIPHPKQENRDSLRLLEVSEDVRIRENLLKLEIPQVVPLYGVLAENNTAGQRCREMLVEELPDFIRITNNYFEPKKREQAWRVISEAVADIAGSDSYKSWALISYIPLALDKAKGNTAVLKENLRVLVDVAGAIKKHKWQYWWMFNFVRVEDLLEKHPDADGIERLMAIDLELGYMEGGRTAREREELRMMLASGATIDVLEFFVALTWSSFERFTVPERQAQQAGIEGAEYINDDQSESEYDYSSGSSMWDMVPIADVFLGSSANFDISSETIRNRYYYFRVVRNFMKVLGDIGLTADFFVKKFNMQPEAVRGRFLSSLTPYNIKESIENLGSKNNDLSKIIELVISENDQANMSQARSMTINIDKTITFAMIKPDAYEIREELIRRLKAAGFEVLFRKDKVLSLAEARRFYAEHKGKPFYDGLVEYITSGPLVQLVLKYEKTDKDGWEKLRDLLGEQDGSTEGSWRRELGVDVEHRKGGVRINKNKVHGSAGSFTSVINELAQVEGIRVILSSEIGFKRENLFKMPDIDLGLAAFVGRSI